jgi:hypothetical protein
MAHDLEVQENAAHGNPGSPAPKSGAEGTPKADAGPPARQDESNADSKSTPVGDVSHGAGVKSAPEGTAEQDKAEDAVAQSEAGGTGSGTAAKDKSEGAVLGGLDDAAEGTAAKPASEGTAVEAKSKGSVEAKSEGTAVEAKSEDASVKIEADATAGDSKSGRATGDAGSERTAAKAEPESTAASAESEGTAAKDS